MNARQQGRRGLRGDVHVTRTCPTRLAAPSPRWLPSQAGLAAAADSTTRPWSPRAAPAPPRSLICSAWSARCTWPKWRDAGERRRTRATQRHRARAGPLPRRAWALGARVESPTTRRSPRSEKAAEELGELVPVTDPALPITNAAQDRAELGDGQGPGRAPRLPAGAN